MIVTINTDPSFSPSLKRGSYAYWIVSNQGKIAKAGMLKKECSNPSIAEFRCIINAFHSLINSGWAGTTKIIVNTDSMNVIHLMRGDKKAIQKYGLRSWGNNLVLTLGSMLARAGIKESIIEWRHVKAHVSTETARQWVNEWCDSQAKYYLNKHFKSLNNK